MVRRCVKVLAGQEYAAKIINTKKLSARGGWQSHALPPSGALPSPLPIPLGLEPGPGSVPLSDAPVGVVVLLPVGIVRTDPSVFII